MSTKALYLMGLIFVIVASYFYASNDASLTRLNLKPSDIDYQARAIEARQTDEKGQISYQLQADQVTHYQHANTAVLVTPKILWRPNAQREVSLVANTAKLDETKQIIQLEGPVNMVSKPLIASALASDQAMQLTGKNFVGDLTQKVVTSQHPVSITQGRNQFTAQNLNANMATGDYTFNQVQMTFAPH